MFKKTGLQLVAAVLIASQAYAERGLARINPLGDKGVSGRVILTESAEGLRIRVNIFKAPPGPHGFHIHEFGDCESEDGSSAGGHYNPEGVKHGHIVNDGIAHAHAGDLGNIEVAQDGTASTEYLVPNLTLTQGRHSVAGRAFIVHEKPDDFGQPLGNAGGRIGCGTIVLVGD